MSHKYQIGDIVSHVTKRDWPGAVKMLIMARGSISDINGSTENIYLVSSETGSSLSRFYILEAEVELAEK